MSEPEPARSAQHRDRVGANSWLPVWRRAGLAETFAQPAYARLAAQYDQPGRRYHNLRHIAECLHELDGVRTQAVDDVALELAIWFHDAIYDSTAADNEEQSAALMRGLLGGAGGGQAQIEVIAALILATKTHEAPAAMTDAALMIDIDLAILGQPTYRFDEYERDIRAEYAWVSEPDYRRGRGAVVQRFLTRPRIYGTPGFGVRYEARARQNLRRALDALNA